MLLIDDKVKLLMSLLTLHQSAGEVEQLCSLLRRGEDITDMNEFDVQTKLVYNSIKHSENINQLQFKLSHLAGWLLRLGEIVKQQKNG
jgi:hypothetical protein